MKCIECGADMRLDYKDNNGKGNYDSYLFCTNCQTSCIECVRFGKPYTEFWHSESEVVKDITIRY